MFTNCGRSCVLLTPYLLKWKNWQLVHTGRERRKGMINRLKSAIKIMGAVWVGRPFRAPLKFLFLSSPNYVFPATLSAIPNGSIKDENIKCFVVFVWPTAATANLKEMSVVMEMNLQATKTSFLSIRNLILTWNLDFSMSLLMIFCRLDSGFWNFENKPKFFLLQPKQAVS